MGCTQTKLISALHIRGQYFLRNYAKYLATQTKPDFVNVICNVITD